MSTTSISWTDRVWNPVIGCTRVSPGCEHCYAEALAPRLSAMGQSQYDGLTKKHGDGSVTWTGEVRCLPERLNQPLQWRKPVRVFVNSMSDLFHEAIPDEFIVKVFAVMAYAQPLHTFQVLTKRPARMRQLVSDESFARAIRDEFLSILERQSGPLQRQNHEGKALQWPLPNIWLGTSVENQDAADERIPLLLQTPAVVRFISAEPLLGPVDLRNVYHEPTGAMPCFLDALAGEWAPKTRAPVTGTLDWVIVGGESGSRRREMDPQWARGLRDQCARFKVPFFYKQGSGLRPGMDTELDGHEWHQFPAGKPS